MVYNRVGCIVKRVGYKVQKRVEHDVKKQELKYRME